MLLWVVIVGLSIKKSAEHVNMRRLAMQVAVLFLVFSAMGAQAEGLSMDAQFEALGKQFLDEYPALSPVGATGLGDHRFDSLLDEVDAAARTREGAFVDRYLTALDGIDRALLSREHQVDYALLRHRLEASRWRLEVFQEWAWNPLEYTGLSGGALYGLMAREFAPVAERLRSATARMEQFPRLFAQVREAIAPARVPKIHAETAVKQNRGVLSIIDQMILPEAGALPDDERARLTQAAETARAAIEEHQKWLEEVLLPQATGEWRIGEELYDQKLFFSLHTPMTRQEIRKRAERQMREVRERMYVYAKEAYAQRHPHTVFPKRPDEAYRRAVIRAGLEMACADLATPEGVVDAARHSLELATDFVREKDLVALPPDPLEIIVMPEFQRGVALAYCDSPGPLDAGQRTFYAVSPPPAEWTPEQVHSHLREYNLRSIHNLTLHEAVPGHYLQLAQANRYPGTLRAILGSGTFIEGWAVYSEWMMNEAGFLDGDPLMRLTTLKWLLRATANAIIDQGVHTGGMTEEEAMRLMVEDAFQEEREAAGKWVRAQLTSAQLSTYFVGQQEHLALRDVIEQAWGEAFDVKRYHDAILAYGSPPVKFVRALILEEAIPK